LQFPVALSEALQRNAKHEARLSNISDLLDCGAANKNQRFFAALRMTSMAKIKQLSHLSSDGRAQMVDVSAKPMSARRAVARGKIHLQRETLDLISKDQIAKGNVFATARLAGIQAAKQTAHLIPLCHTIPLSEVNIDVVTSNQGAEVKCTAQTIAQTGVEMEALVGVSIALLTIYDMCKAVDKKMQIYDVQLIEKTKTAVAASLREAHSPNAKASQRRVAHRATATTNDHD
jgi:cyclic pyranopterin phosphate synthase